MTRPGRLRLVVHVGLHRAGSTAIQNWLLAEAENFAGQGVFAHARPTSGGTPSPFALLAGRAARTTPAKVLAGYLGEALGELSQGFRAGIVSDENLLGAMPGINVRPFGNLQKLLEVFEELRGVADIVPVVVLREHFAWLVSLYRTYLSRGGTRTFQDFCNSMAGATVRFAPLLTRLQAVGPVIADSLEHISADGGRRLTEGLAAALGVRANTPTLAPHNRSFADNHLRIASELGHRRAVLAQHGGPELADAIAHRDREAITRIVHARAVKVAWGATPSLRMNRAASLYLKGLPDSRRLALDECRAIVSDALAAGPIGPDSGALPLDAFAADRQSVAEQWLPEWRIAQ